MTAYLGTFCNEKRGKWFMSKSSQNRSHTKKAKDQARRPDDLENLFCTLRHGNLFTFLGKVVSEAICAGFRCFITPASTALNLHKRPNSLTSRKAGKVFQNRLKLSISRHKRAIREKYEHKNRRNYVPTCMLSTNTKNTRTPHREPPKKKTP